MSDSRFARLKTDPRFRKLRKKKNKVVVDERFKSVFSRDPKNITKLTARVDKYGRKLSKSHDTENLKRFYRSEGDVELLASSVPDYARGGILMESEEEEEENSYAEDSDLDNDGPIILGKHPRKPILLEEIEVNLDESQFAELDALAKVNIKKSREEEQAANASNVDKTNRIAVVNLDWDHVRANHLYKIFSSVAAASSFKKGTSTAPIGKILNVRIYPSQFGKTRMEHEAKAGPPKDIFKKQSDVEENDGKDYDDGALRKYQLERLQYYYAIVTCDTPETAAHIFSELDGTELERSANIFDLSYVPNEMSFADEYTDEAEEEVTSYKAVEFVTDALRHSKVKLTWDDDDPERVKMTRRALSKKELEEADFKAFLASASSDESTDVDGDVNAEAKREKIRSLLLNGVDEHNEDLLEGRGKNIGQNDEMEITFTPGLSGSKDNVDPGEETTRERYLRKQKERRRQKYDRLQKNNQAKEAVGDDFFGEDGDDEDPSTSSKNDPSAQSVQPNNADTAELELLQATLGGDQELKHFDMRAVIKAEKSKPRKRQREKKRNQNNADEVQEDFVLDIKDSRFKALHEDHAFAIDPSNPHFKKTKNMSTLLEERAKRRQSKDNFTSSTKSSLSDNNNLNSRGLENLVERVKRKFILPTNKTGESKRRRMLPESSESLSIDLQQIIAAFSLGHDVDTRSSSIRELYKYIATIRQKQVNAEEGTKTINRLITPVLESRLAETDEVTLISTLQFFSTLFQLDVSCASEIFCRDGILSSIMDIPDILPSSKLALHYIAGLLSQASSSKQCRPLISSDENGIRMWLERYSQQTSDSALQAVTAVALIKLSQGLEDCQNAIMSNQTPSSVNRNFDVDRLFESIKQLIASSPTALPQSSISDSIEGLVYLTVRSSFKERLAHDTSFLNSLMKLARETKASFTASYGDISLFEPTSADLNYGISAIVLNLSSYRRRLSEEEQHMEKLRLMTRFPKGDSSLTEKNRQSQLDPLEDDAHVKIRCKELLQAGAAEALSNIVRNTITRGSGRSVAIRRTIGSAFLHLSEDKENRGKILQGGGAKALLSIIQTSSELQDVKMLELKKIDSVDVVELQAIQALAKLSITSPPNVVFGTNSDGYIDAIRPFSILLVHSSSSLLQKFEALMAFTNLASISPEAADRLATFRFQNASKHVQLPNSFTGTIMQRCEQLLLDNNFMVRRAAMELICNLVGGSETAFEYFGGTAESSSKSRLHILIALSDVEDLATRLAALGALAVLTASPYPCRSLAELELERHIVLPILVGAIAPSIAIQFQENGEHRTEENEAALVDAGLVHRGIVSIRNIFANLDSREERMSMSTEGERKGLVQALVHVVKHAPGGPNNASIIKPAAEVLKWMVEAGIKLPL